MSQTLYAIAKKIKEKSRLGVAEWIALDAETGEDADKCRKLAVHLLKLALKNGEKLRQFEVERLDNPLRKKRPEVSQTKKQKRSKDRMLEPSRPCAHPELVELYRYDLLGWLSNYLPARFNLNFSEDHKRMIALLQSAILDGGQFAIAMPRGSGKTTVCEGAAIWALIYGHRKFLFVVGSDNDAALSICASIRDELAENEKLLEDFPEACHPIASLDGIARRAEGQTDASGDRTGLIWTKNQIRMPAKSGGSVIRTAGITGRIRGAKASMIDGSQTRPDLVLVDDPQTDESARSVSQVATRMRTMSGTILGLGGPGQKIAAMCTCTVIEKGDLADQILDRKEHPEWQGVKAKLMQSMPTDKAHWDKYSETFKEEMRTERDHSESQAYYQENREAMDANAVASWPERKSPGELSAIQHAMNLLIVRGLPAFMAEYQNEPQDPMDSKEVVQLTTAAVLKKLNGHDKGIVPSDSVLLTASIDVQGPALYWCVCAWANGFSGDLLAYGCYPDQGRSYFAVQEIEKKLETVHPGASWEASLYAGLDSLLEILAGKEWQRDDGGIVRIEQVIIDAGYGKSTETVYSFCRRSKYSSILLPYFGRVIAPGQTPMGEYKKKPGERVGQDWRIPKATGTSPRHVIADANKWKSFTADRILTQPGDAGSLNIYGSEASAHRMLADQIASEIRTKVTANGRSSDQWRVKPNRDNHFLDCLSMASIAASIRGMKLDDQAISRAIKSVQESTENAQKPPEPALKPATQAPPRRPNRQGSWFSGFGFGGAQ
jgi:hypothetical protein